MTEMNYKPYIDNDELQKSFGFCMNIEKTFHVHLCLYTINEFHITTSKENKIVNTLIPYVKFIVEKKDNYSFPFFEYRCPIINEIHSNTSSTAQLQTNVPPQQYNISKEEGNDEKNHFETEIFKQWLNIYTDTSELHDLNIQFNNEYKGYIDMGENDLFVFINVDKINFPLKENMIYVTMDEILFKKSALSIRINEKVTHFFKSHPELIHMKTEIDEEIPIPFQLYMCKVENELYTTISKEDIDYIYHLEHGIFGPGYLFTNETLGEKDTLRFVCHIDKCLYILEPISEIDTNKMSSIKETSSISTCVYFHENDMQLWLLRNINAIHIV